MSVTKMLTLTFMAFSLPSLSAGDNDNPDETDQSGHVAPGGALENQVLEKKQALDALMHATQKQAAPVAPVITSSKRDKIKDELAQEEKRLDQYRLARSPMLQASLRASGEAGIYKEWALGIGSFGGTLGVAFVVMGAVGGIAALAALGGAILGVAVIAAMAFLIKAQLASNAAEQTNQALESNEDSEIRKINDRIQNLNEKLSLPENGPPGPNQNAN